MHRRAIRTLTTAAAALAVWASGSVCALAEDATAVGQPVRRTPIIIGLPLPQSTQPGEIELEPNVQINGAAPGANSASRYSQPAVTGAAQRQAAAPSEGIIQTAGQLPVVRALPVKQPPSPPVPDTRTPLPPPFAGAAQPEPLPGSPPPGLSGPGPSSLAPGSSAQDVPAISQAEPMFAQTLGADCGPDGGGHHHSHHHGTFYGLGGVEEGPGDPGIGHERVMFAPYFLDVSEPSSNMRFRFQAYYDQHNPDRAEYFWAQIGGRGPKLPGTLGELPRRHRLLGSCHGQSVLGDDRRADPIGVAGNQSRRPPDSAISRSPPRRFC